MITIYSKPNCPQCDQAKSFMKLKNIEYREIILDVGQPKQEGVTYLEVPELKKMYPMVKQAPVVVKDGKFVGSYKELLNIFQ